MKAAQGFIEGVQPLGPGLLLHLRWSTLELSCSPGQLFLVRCTPTSGIWDPYLRRSLFPALITPNGVALWLTDDTDRGQAWLMTQPRGTRIDLLGPVGHGFTLPSSPGHVLVLARDERVGPVWPLMTQALSMGHQVTLVLSVSCEELAVPSSLVPVTIEYRLHVDDAQAGCQSHVLGLLEDLKGWPDRIYAALPHDDWPGLRAWIESWRPLVEPGFAQVLVWSDIVCGVGACLSCVVERADGRLTRACVHGPVMDLTLVV